MELPIMAYTEKLHPKGRDICHFGLKKGPKKLQTHSMDVKEARKLH